jgi:transcriptional regulator with XRE-family HTH domain
MALTRTALRRTARRDAREDRDRAEPSALPQEIIDEITWYMRQHKMTRADLASAMGVSAGRVSQILSGDENITLRTLGAVVDALGARLDVTMQTIEDPREILES